jgi:hypothetical protein
MVFLVLTGCASSPELVQTLAERPITHMDTEKIVLTDSEGGCGASTSVTITELFIIQKIWDTIHQSRPYGVWCACGYRKLEFYRAGHPERPAVILLVNETDACHIEGTSRRFRCPGINAVLEDLLKHEYNKRHPATAGNQVADFMARLALASFDPDWDGYDSGMERIFSDSDIEMISRHKTAVQEVVLAGLEQRGGSKAALIAAHMRLCEALPLLREDLFKARSPYLWEGPDYAKEDSVLDDNQFQYHSAYINAIETITGKPIREAVKPTDKELERLRRMASKAKLKNPQTPEWWAKWLLRKLD